jgi:hypothetical protein
VHRSLFSSISLSLSVFRTTMAAGWKIVLLGLSVANADASERSNQLVESFQIFCTQEAPNFDRLDERAASMKLPARNELEIPKSGNLFSQLKAWLVFLSSGPHELRGSEAQGPDGKITSCGIAAPDVDGDELQSTLTTALNLSAPLSVTISTDGEQRATTWKFSRSMDEMMLVLTDDTPTGRHGISLTLIHLEPRKS